MSSEASLLAALRASGWRDATPSEGIAVALPGTDDYVNVLAPLWYRTRTQLFETP